MGGKSKALGDRRSRIRQAAGAGVGRGERNEKSRRPPAHRRGCVRALRSPVVVALKEKDETGDLPVDWRKIGVEPQRRLDGGGSLGMIAGEQLDVAERDMRLGISGAECDGALGRGDRLLVAAIDDLHDGENGIGQ